MGDLRTRLAEDEMIATPRRPHQRPPRPRKAQVEVSVPGAPAGILARVRRFFGGE
jgi:hypothetical protein